MRAIWKRFRREEQGAEAVEFAFIAPILFFLIFGLIYLMLMFAAQLSLGYATNVAVRYAAIPVSGSTYPTSAQVVAKAANATPFFSTSSCTPTLNSPGVNQPVVLTMDCDFPNPAGGAVGAFKQTFFGGGNSVSSTLELSATAQSRKE